MVAGENRSDHGRLRGRLRRNHGKGRARNLHRRGYCLTLWGQQQHDADAGRRRDRRDRREPGRHSRPHVAESRPCQLDAEGPAMARSGRRPGILQAARHEDPRAHLVHLESSAVRNSDKMPVSPARSARPDAGEDAPGTATRSLPFARMLGRSPHRMATVGAIPGPGATSTASRTGRASAQPPAAGPAAGGERPGWQCRPGRGGHCARGGPRSA
jgi:hypothetical protein